MEGGGETKIRPLIINEVLTQGKDLTKQLKNHLEMSADELTCESLVDKILSSYEKALSMLNNTTTSTQPPPAPTSSSADDEITTHHPCTNKNIFKKRKTTGKWSEQVKVCSAAGTTVEGPLSDGYSWRKYGQKDILGANHPRAYYRCTHRNVQGCLATKQVQRSDQDTSVFEVTYKGRHTCIQATQLSKALEKKPKQEQEENIHDSKPPTKKMCIERVFSFKANKTEEGLFPSFSFASTPIETEKLEKLFYVGCDSTTFITLNDNFQSSDSDLSDMMNSTPNSSTNSPLVDWDFSLDQEDFDGNFYFDAEMFS